MRAVSTVEVCGAVENVAKFSCCNISSILLRYHRFGTLYVLYNAGMIRYTHQKFFRKRAYSRYSAGQPEAFNKTGFAVRYLYLEYQNVCPISSELGPSTPFPASECVSPWT